VLALSGRQAILRHELSDDVYADRLSTALEDHIRHGRSFAPAPGGRTRFGWGLLIAGAAIGAVLGAMPFLVRLPG